MKLEVGTRVQACGKTWTVKRVGRIYYHLAVDGSKTLHGMTFEIPKTEAHADIQSGKATIIVGQDK